MPASLVAQFETLASGRNYETTTKVYRDGLRWVVKTNVPLVADGTQRLLPYEEAFDGSVTLIKAPGDAVTIDPGDTRTLYRTAAEFVALTGEWEGG